MTKKKVSMSSASSSSLLDNPRPPGPSGLPLVGSKWNWEGPQTNLAWTRKYGPIYQVRMVDKDIVYLNTLELVTKYLEGRKGEVFLDRPHGPAAIAEGLLHGNGEHWKKNKKAFMNAFHTTTFLKHLEAAIQTEVTIMLSRLSRGCNKPMKIGNDLLPACTNVIAGLLLGGFLPQDCDDRKKLLKIAKNMEGVDLLSIRTQISIKYPALRETLKKLTFSDIVDVHGTHIALQRILRQWILQARKGTLTPAHIPFHVDPINIKETESTNKNVNSDVTSLTCPHLDKSIDSDTEQNMSGSPNSDQCSNSNGKQASTSNQHHGKHDDSDTRQNPSGSPHSGQSSNSNGKQAPTTDTHRDKPGDSDNETSLLTCPSNENSNDSDVVPRKRPRLKMPTVADDSQGAQSLDCTKDWSSEECLLTPPQDERNLELGLRSVSFFTAFGFSETSKGELPFEIPEVTPTEDPPHTPLTEFNWRFQKSMSLNLQQKSILQRIIDQPEFHGVTEENDEELLQSLIDLFFGGITSTLSALEFTLLYLSQNPLMQREAQDEIDAELERSGGPRISWEARERMPYIRACITEALRLGAITPSSLPHVAREDTEIEGYFIPKGRLVLGSIYSLHYDPAHFLDPQVFRPQRHIRDGKFEQPKSFRPYGIGARRCIGDSMAEMQLFLFTVRILMHFNVRPADDRKDPSKDTYMRIIHRLKNFRCIISQRKPSKQ